LTTSKFTGNRSHGREKTPRRGDLRNSFGVKVPLVIFREGVIQPFEKFVKRYQKRPEKKSIFGGARSKWELKLELKVGDAQSQMSHRAGGGLYWTRLHGGKGRKEKKGFTDKVSG